VKGIEGAVLLIILGAYLIIKPLIDKRQLFGKAEEK
jgi:putative Mn2+ efflux pump MntP